MFSGKDSKLYRNIYPEHPSIYNTHIYLESLGDPETIELLLKNYDEAEDPGHKLLSHIMDRYIYLAGTENNWMAFIEKKTRPFQML